MFVWTCVDGTPALWVVSSATALDPISFQFLEFAPGGYGAVGGTHKCQQAQSFLSAAPVSFYRPLLPYFASTSLRGISLPLTSIRYRVPRQVTCFPENDRAQINTWSKSFRTGMPQVLASTRPVKRRSNSAAASCRNDKQSNAKPKLRADGVSATQSNGQSEAFPMMLKNAGTGWQTRIVLAHRN